MWCAGLVVLVLVLVSVLSEQLLGLAVCEELHSVEESLTSQRRLYALVEAAQSLTAPRAEYAIQSGAVRDACLQANLTTTQQPQQNTVIQTVTQTISTAKQQRISQPATSLTQSQHQCVRAAAMEQGSRHVCQ